MKKLLVLLLCAALLLGLAACRDSEGKTPSSGKTNDNAAAESKSVPDEPAIPELAAELPTVLNQTEYVLYQNIFFNGAADDYLGKTMTKEGTFTRLTDAFSGKTRYYVWGYNDATKCCDWQWEFVPKDPDSLPANGCLVKMTGTMTRDDAALDKIWFTDAELVVEKLYAPEACDVDMSTMDGTLERVQILNMQYRSEAFEGVRLRIYGRMQDLSAIQHPYYDGAWTQEFKAKGQNPAIGTMVILTGTWSSGKIVAERVEGTNLY